MKTESKITTTQDLPEPDQEIMKEISEDLKKLDLTKSGEWTERIMEKENDKKNTPRS